MFEIDRISKTLIWGEDETSIRMAHGLVELESLWILIVVGEFPLWVVRDAPEDLPLISWRYHCLH